MPAAPIKPTPSKTYRLILAARSVRTLAYGAISVILAIYLGSIGLRAAAIGAILSIAFLTGAIFSIAAGPLARRIGTRAILLIGSALMLMSGVLLAGGKSLGVLIAAAALGTISPGGQEVGPFTAIEQAMIANIGDRGSARRFAVYGLLGSLGLAFGALVTSFMSPRSIFEWYAAVGAALIFVYAFMTNLEETNGTQGSVAKTRRRKFGPAESLAALFSVDALAGGFVAQSIIAYWFHLKFGMSTHTLGFVFFGANTLSALSLLVAARLSERIGLLNTMVFTHLPSNILLIAVPLMPTAALAIFVLLVRFAISQMDVPTRQAFTMAVVDAGDRAYAAGLTNAVRPVAAAVAPVLSGIALQTAASGFPFFAAGGLKIAYDLTLYRLFKGQQKRVQELSN